MNPIRLNNAALTTQIEPSESLRRFTSEYRNERQSILDFALRAARELPAGSRLLDVGAGNSPYRELFAHLVYESNDWQHSLHPGARAVDHIGPAHAIPVADAQYDAVFCTQVLEHVPNPREVLAEICRVLKPGGHLYMTVPLAWELHEQPFDFFRYTAHGLWTMLSDTGFDQLDIRPRNDSPSTLAQLLRNVQSTLGSYPDGRDPVRAQVGAAMQAIAAQVESLNELDARWILPLGFSARAHKPAVGGTSRGVDAATRASARQITGLAEARRFVTLCFAQDLLADPRILGAYAQHFTDADDATLAIYAPDVDVQLASRALSELVDNAGLNGSGSPHMIGLPFKGRADENALATAVDAALSFRPPWGAFTGVSWAHTGNLAELRAFAIVG
jgi:SAM-dependent methyltransferase